MSPMKQVSFALSVSLLNPHAILDTIGVIGSSAALYSGSNKLHLQSLVLAFHGYGSFYSQF